MKCEVYAAHRRILAQYFCHRLYIERSAYGHGRRSRRAIHAPRIIRKKLRRLRHLAPIVSRNGRLFLRMTTAEKSIKAVLYIEILVGTTNFWGTTKSAKKYATAHLYRIKSPACYALSHTHQGRIVCQIQLKSCP